MNNKILIIEDDLNLATPLKEYFEENGIRVFLSISGNRGLTIYENVQPDLIILDVILPDSNGFDIIKSIRKKDITTPVILMTGTEFNDSNQVKAYQLGSLNFMAKPIIPQALLALAQYVLKLPKELKKYKIGHHEIQIQPQYISIGSEKIELREKDSCLLLFLIERVNQVVSREMLLQQIWLDDHQKNNNLLDGAILRLRRVFADYPEIGIKSIYGIGYVLEFKNI